MAQGTPESTERNLELCEDYKNGMEIPAIIGKYKLSNKRIYDIINGYGIPKRRKPRKDKKSGKGGEN